MLDLRRAYVGWRADRWLFNIDEYTNHLFPAYIAEDFG